MKYVIHKEKPIGKKTKKMLLPIILNGIVILLLLAQVIVSNRLATTGSNMNSLEEEIQTLAQQNKLLDEQIASNSALLTLKQRSVILGFTKTIKPIFLSQEPPVAGLLR